MIESIISNHMELSSSVTQKTPTKKTDHFCNFRAWITGSRTSITKMVCPDISEKPFG